MSSARSSLHPAHRSVALALVLLALAGSGCSTTKLAVGSMVPILEESVAAGMSSADLELVKDGMPANLILLDGLVRTDPRPELLTLGAELYFSYAFAFVEDEDPERAAGLYAIGRDYGRRALAADEKLGAALASGRAEDLSRALARRDREDVPALVWTAAAWAGWANLSLDQPAAVADLAVIQLLLERADELDASFMYGVPPLLLGAFHAARPPILGGDPELARRYFARAAEVGAGKLLLAPVFEARYYARSVLDEELFVHRLNAALAEPLDIAPDIRLLNAVAQRKARDLLARQDELF
jgi:hypothetical protein